MPALPLDEAGKYVAAAYLVFLALLLIYVAIMAARLQRINRELGELADRAERRAIGISDPDPTEADTTGSDEVAVGAAGPASPSTARPAESGREAEHLGGGIPRG